MSITLYPHQIQGSAFLASKAFAGLFAGMGTGKTLTSLDAVRSVWAAEGALRVLIVAPPIALPMWQREAASYLGLPEGVAQILKSGTAKLGVSAQIVVTSYQLAVNRRDELAAWANGGILICDECHALKSVKAKRTKAILGSGGLASNAAHTWLLTGTPITRWNDDMYPFLCRADLSGMKGKLGGVTKERFDLYFTVRKKKQWAGARYPVMMTVGNRHTDELADWVYGEGHALRFDLEEVFKSMPPLTVNRYTIDIDADAELKSMLKDLEKLTQAEIQQKMQAKEPALATVRRRLGAAKVRDAVKEIKERIESGQKVLVGAWHNEVIDALFEGLKGYARGVIDGRTSAANRETCVAEWNAGNVDVLIGQIAAMGVSLNLQQGGHQIIVVEEDWSPSIMDQFYARLWRFGQERHVHVDILQSDSKLDQALASISSAKQRQHAIFNKIGKEYTDAAE